jgi:hypothetical protein
MLCLTPVLALAQMDVPAVTYPKLVQRASSLAGFVPRGWVVEQIKRTDLNGDGRTDAVFVLHGNDPRNILENKVELGAPRLNTNPRMVAVVFARAGGFDLIAQNHNLIPRYDSPNMDDPFNEISLKNGKFRVEIGFWASAGSWMTSTTSFLFRFQDGCVRLIGYDRHELGRNTGDTTDISVNYLTGKVKKTTGNEGTGASSTRWSTMGTNRKLCLQTMGNGYEFDPETGKP